MQKVRGNRQLNYLSPFLYNKLSKIILMYSLNKYEVHNKNNKVKKCLQNMSNDDTEQLLLRKV